MSLLFMFSLYFTSFAPLWVSILFIDGKSILEGNENLWTEWISMGCIVVLMVICIFIMMSSLYVEGREGTLSYKLESAKEQKAITAEYLLSYILPLFAFDFTRWDQVVLFLIFFVILGVLCIRHKYFSVNIILDFANYRFYDCSLKSEDGSPVDMLILSHRKLNGEAGDMIDLKSINNEIKLDIKQK